MKVNNNFELPSNQKFGYFFTFVFLFTSLYLYFKELIWLSTFFGFCSIVFFVITLIKADILRPLNVLWMKFGLILGMIVNPLVMGVIFFFVFTPIGILIRLFGRDELLLKFKNKSSYWAKRNDTIHSNSFWKQY